MYSAWQKGARSSRNGQIQRASFPEKNRVSTRAGKHDWPFGLIPWRLYRADREEANRSLGAGSDPAAALFSNLQILVFTYPFWPCLRALRPPPAQVNSLPPPPPPHHPS